MPVRNSQPIPPSPEGLDSAASTDLRTGGGPEGNVAEHNVVADDLLQAMARVRRANRRHGGRPVELSSLTGAQLELVRLLRRRPGASVVEAASELRLAPNTVSTLLRQLTQVGLVSRNVDSSDRRVARLELASDIARKVDAWRDRRVVAVSDAIGRLPRREVRCLSDAVAALGLLAEQLEAQGEGR